MAKILKCDESTVVIGMDDKTVKEVRVSDCNFTPKAGMEVEVFSTETSNYVTEVVKETVSKPQEQGINISINNDNNNSNNAQGMVYASGGKVVNKIVYLVLTFFLGGIGGHKFYAGKIGTGILFLLFCWTGVPVFIALVEFIFACFKRADINGNIVI